MSDSPAISVNALGKVYKDGLIRPKRFEALKEVSFEVNRGEIFGLLGPNGAGKTTFLKILLGIIRKTSGTATMMGLPAGSRPGRKLVGYLPEHLRVPQHMTGYTALECYGNLSDVPTREIREKRGPLLDLVGLGERGADHVKKYSKGMLQRLGLAQALLHDPQLLVLDEPTDGLDPKARAEMRQVIRNLKSRGVTVFLNSHILQEVEMICDRVAILHRGKLLYCGQVSEIGSFVKELAGGASVGTRVRFSLKGELSEINLAFEKSEFEIQPLGNERQYFVTLNSDGQDEIDLLVDRLREREVSLMELRVERVTLEEAFLKLIDDSDQKPTTPRK